MTTGPGDTISVAADTLSLPASRTGFSIGRIIPLPRSSEATGSTSAGTLFRGKDYYSVAGRADGLPLPGDTLNYDFIFVLLSFSLLIVTMLAVSGRKSLITGLSAIGFRKRPGPPLAGTSEVFSWPPMLRNAFTVVNVSLFAMISLLSTDMIRITDPHGSPGLTAIISGVFLGALILRHLASMVVAEITGWKLMFREYMNVVYNVWFAGALLFFILSGIIIFAEVNNTLPIIITGIIVMAILLIIRILRLLTIFHKRHVSVFYFILYLCALEVLPLLVVLKITGAF